MFWNIPAILIMIDVYNNTKLTVERKPNQEKRVSVSTYKDGLYCGPGWGFTNQDVESGAILEKPEAFDAIDKACKLHDQCYADHGYFTQACNVQLAADLVRIVKDPSSTRQLRYDAIIMAAIFAVEAMTWDVMFLEYRRLGAFIDAGFRSGVRTMESVIRQAYSARKTMCEKTRVCW